MQIDSSLYEDFLFSCVVDSNFKFQSQVHSWATSLIDLAGVPGRAIVVHTVASLDPALESWLRDAGVEIRAIAPFRGHAYCNKLAQLDSLSTFNRPFVVMMDCDTVVTAPISWPKPQAISAKRVDTAQPPRTILTRIFAEAGLGEPHWAESDLLPGPEGRSTDSNNCNGGVYVVERGFLAQIRPVWRRWALWCIENQSLFGPAVMHIDQVALALATRELEIEITPLPRSCNMPTHLPLPAEVDVDALVLHYHWQIDSQLLLKSTGLPRVDAAITRVNECLVTARRTGFLSSIFFGARYQLFPELGAGVGSTGESLQYKQHFLLELVPDPAQSVLDIGCGDLAVSCGLPATRYLGVDAAGSGIETARQRRPDWQFVVGDAVQIPLDPADVVLCLDVLIHQPTYAVYRQLVERMCALAKDTLIVAAYDTEPAFVSSITFYYEPITKTLAECGGFTEVSIIGKYRDIFVAVARKRPPSSHVRDLPAADFNVMSLVTDYPLTLRSVVDEARSQLGFFPAHTPRALEYPWLLENLARDLCGQVLLDVGAGVNPVPLMLAKRGAKMFTVDAHREERNLSQRSNWNEWGFLDYSQLDHRITSVRCSYEDWAPATLFHCIYSLSVIEHLKADTRRVWIERFAAQLGNGGLLLLTIDIVPETNRLWCFAEGKVVEPEELHGTMETLLQELRASGFMIETAFLKRNIPHSRVDIGLVRARRD